ncbi:hypothetical protein D0Z00_001233 [Geotrichum galactomycetum]|uniref:Uncharacterized protein n=1 Tax=Geotrichum galactomycetum TaxID=27317 RepID=A0ACB6V7G2_9ASCO|nr:hypothetical protein D0Z00_001233 [Geotrichum candidum]
MNLQPTYTGYVSSTEDALLLFQATIDGKLPAVSRRPHDRERTELVRSGAAFVFNEQASGIKRWTDGIAWSPSRILGNFLVYRQLEKPFTPGEKKQANRRSSSTSSAYLQNGAAFRSVKRTSPYLQSTQNRRDLNSMGSEYNSGEEIKYPISATGSVTGSSLPIQLTLPNQIPSQNGNDALAGSFEKEMPIERSLVGSLVDSYGFKKDGLIKKTMSIIVHGQPHHLVSYYKPEDVISGIFETPKDNAYLKDIVISDDITSNQNFRIPLENKNDMAHKSTGNVVQQQQQLQQLQIPHQMHPMQHSHHAMSQAALPHLSYMAGPPQALGGPQGYEMSTYEMEDLLKNGGGVSAAGTTGGGLPFFRTSQPLTNSSYMTAAAANTGYRSYGPSSLVPPQEQSQNQFLQSEYYSTVTTSPTAAGMSATTTTSPQYQIGRLATSTNVYLPSLPPLTQSYSYQSYNTSTAGPFSTVDSDPAQPVQLAQQTIPQQQQQQQFAESDPRRLPESSVATSTQGYSPRPFIATVQQQPHPPQQPISTGYGYNYGTNYQGQW